LHLSFMATICFINRDYYLIWTTPINPD
jgi:hypothetical protein